MNLKDKTAIVYDRGIYMSLAARLARDFGRVLLYNPAWKTTWPRFTDAQIGAGLLENEGVERIENFFDHLDEADIIVFPDTLDADLVNHLRGLGKRVWGSGYAESLELDRIDTLEYLKELNLPVPKYKVVNGLDALREYLKSHEDVYVKVSIFRGTFETFHSETYNLTEPLLDKLEGELGPVKNRIIFSVFEPLEGIELAFDGFSIDGQFPKKVPLGFEVKDMGWCAKVKDYKDLYPAVKEFNKAIAPTLKLNKYRNFMSPEIRVTKDGTGYMCDFCARFPSPVSEVYYELIGNFSEIIWAGADGELVEPEYVDEYAMTLAIYSDWARENWQGVYIEKEALPYVKLRNYTIVDNVYYIVPNTIDKNDCIGVIVATGNSLEDCAAKVNKYADMVKGYRIKIECATVDKMQKVIDSAKEFGVSF